MKTTIQTTAIIISIIFLLSSGLILTNLKVQNIRQANEQINEEWEEFNSTLNFIHRINDILNRKMIDQNAHLLFSENMKLIDEAIEKFNAELEEINQPETEHEILEFNLLNQIKEHLIQIKLTVLPLTNISQAMNMQNELRVLEKQLFNLQQSDIKAMGVSLQDSLEEQSVIIHSIQFISITVIIITTFAGMAFVFYIRRMSRRMILQEKLVTAGQMTQILSHEIRNPLGIIKSSSSILKGHVSHNPEAMELTQYLIEECDRIDGLICQLGTLKSRKYNTFREVEPKHILDSVVKLTSAAASKSEISIRYHATWNTSKIKADVDQIKQAVLNIILNAIQASRSGGSIDISLEPWLLWCKITIEDHAGGLPDIIQRHLFEPFMTTKSNGTGLGLIVAKQIITRHHGKLNLTSRQKKGTTVTILLPIIK
ncbi:MAG: hypothetical protein KC713_09170 [Candidatus Omnitrophica bacterium]|nr:hypothetical protein [Candidatus Omnitrophota bacterium]